MKKIFFACLIFLSNFSINGNAQDATVPVPVIMLSDFIITVGANIQESANPSLADFKSLAPGSTLLQSDLSGFEQVADPDNSKAVGSIGFFTGIRFGDRK